MTDRKWWVLAGVSIVSFLGCLDLTIVNTAAPAIGTGLDASLTELQLVVNVFVVALAMFMVTAGRLADAFGRRRVLYLGTVLFGLASLGAGCARSVEPLVVFRFLQGAACAGLYTSSSTIVADVFPAGQRGRAIGTLFAVNGFGLAAGPLLGGVIVGLLGWPWVFLGNVPLVALALLICAFALRGPVAGVQEVRLDGWGLALLAAGICGVVAGLTFGGPLAWTALGLGVAALVAFLLVERIVANPVMPMRLLGSRRFALAMVADFGLAFFYTTALFLIPQYLAQARRLEALAIGLLMLPATATVAVLSPLVGRMVEAVGPARVLAGGFAAFTVSAVWQSLLDAHSATGQLLVAFGLMGVGWSAVLGPAAVAALAAVPERDSGLAVGATWTAHNVGGAVGLALGMAVFRAVGAGSFMAGYHAASLLLAGAALAVLLAVLWLGRSGNRLAPLGHAEHMGKPRVP